MRAMGIDLNIESILGPLPKRKPEGALKRELTSVDIDLAQSAQGVDLGTEVSVVKRIRHTHHALAQLVAAGRRNEEIGAIMGYSPSYISSLKSDPAFKSLIAFYKHQADEEFRAAQISLHDRLASISMVATEELLDRVTDAPEKFSNDQLMDLTKLSADRTGYGPQSRNTNVNLNVNLADRLESARNRARLGAPSPSPLLEGSPLPSPEDSE